MTTGGTLTLQTGENSDSVWVSVTDTGGGIPQEQINRDLRAILHDQRKKGSGLGLMIVQRIVRRPQRDGLNWKVTSAGEPLSGSGCRCTNASRVCWRRQP